MSAVTECPVCGLHEQQVETSDGGNRMNVRCERCGNFKVTTGAARKVVKSGLAGHLSAWIRDHKKSGRTPPEITQDNVDDVLNNIPKYGVSDKQRILLQTLEKKTTFPGDHIGLNLERDFPVAWASRADEFQYLLKALADRGLVNAPEGFHNVSCSVVITPSGWDVLDEMARPSGDCNQAFVAMSFAKELFPVWNDGIKPALERAEYRA